MALILAVFTAPVLYTAVTDGADTASVVFVAVMWWAFWLIATLTSHTAGDCGERPSPPSRRVRGSISPTLPVQGYPR